MNCPLCHSVDIEHWHRRKQRDYWCCLNCQLVFVPAGQHLTAQQEKAEYDKHNNVVDDPGYRAFLARAFHAVVERQSPGAVGLDFGCGPGPALAAMLEDAGYSVRLYDLFYHPDETVWHQSYQFICMTEVIEHLAQPAKLLQTLWSLLRPGGCLVIQTQRVLDRSAFSQWRYLHDPTHIAFYAEATFEWLAQSLPSASMEFPARDVAVLTKMGADS